MAAEAVISIALETFRDLLLEEGRFLSGVGNEVRSLQTQLIEMRCLLEDADKQRHENKTVGNWIKEMTDLAYRAQDAIETYAVEVSSKRSSGELKQLLRRFCCILKEPFSLHQIGSEILEIKSGIQRVTGGMQEYGIRSIIQGESSSNDNQAWKRQTSPVETDDCFVGKKDEIENLVSLALDDEDQRHRLISIWGMGGIGKTTIVKKVYNHIEIKRSFESFAWVCVTQRCQIRSVLEDVLKQLNPQINIWSSMGNTELIVQLCQIQKDRRCMIVLDDVWEIDHWHGLKHGFLGQGLKSKILLTTRNRNVAKMGHAIELGLLNADDGWELLKKKAFPHNSIPEFLLEEKMILEKMGKEMVHKCGYLPLVISLHGGVLSNKQSLGDWEVVNKNVHIYEVGDSVKEEVHGVLNLSYEDLPYYLKPCFLIMGLYKEDQLIYVNDLYATWIAQGMISRENRRNEESSTDIAEMYLSELVSRCIVQAVDFDSTSPKIKFIKCKLHDVVRELCLSMGKNEDFGVEILDCQGGNFSTLLCDSLSSGKTRHLAIDFDEEVREVNDEITMIDEDKCKHVRSLKFISSALSRTRIEVVLMTIPDIQIFKFVTSLTFFKFDFGGRKLPKGIGTLILLRSLCLFRCVRLNKLPSSISNLAYLEILSLNGSLNIRVPNVLKKLSRLKHLILPHYNEELTGNYHLRLDEGLDQLEILIGFDSSVHELKSFSRMKNLRKFAAKVYDNDSLLAVVNAISTNWKNLRFSGIEIKQGCEFIGGEKGLADLKKVLSCPNLNELTIDLQLGGVLEECLNEIITSKLVCLELCECEIEVDPMRILGQLPFLKGMWLSTRSFIGEEITCGALSFPRLTELVLRGLPNLRQWRVEEGAMPIISKLYIVDCYCLEMIPDGLKSIVTLQYLEITGNPELQKRVYQGGEDFHKVAHIPSIITY